MGFFFDNLWTYHLKLEVGQEVQNEQPSLLVGLALEVLDECAQFVGG